MLIVLSSMTLSTMMSVSAMPVHGHCRPNQPDDVLTFSKNHLCVYKELPLLHNRLMHIPASACTCKPGLLAQNPAFCTFCFDVIGAAPSGQASTWAFFQPVVHFEQLGQIPFDFLGQIPLTLNPYWLQGRMLFERIICIIRKSRISTPPAYQFMCFTLDHFTRRLVNL